MSAVRKDHGTDRRGGEAGRDKTARRGPGRPDSGGRDRLIEAAILLFARSGYSATSVASICAHAEVTKPVLYWHFENKEGLLAAVLETLNERWIEQVRAQSQIGATPLERLEGLLQEWRRLVIEQSPLLRLPLLAALEVTDPPERIRSAVRAIWSESHDALVEGVASSSGIAAARLGAVASVAIALLETAMVRYALDRDATSLDAQLQEIRHVVSVLVLSELQHRSH